MHSIGFLSVATSSVELLIGSMQRSRKYGSSCDTIKVRAFDSLFRIAATTAAANVRTIKIAFGARKKQGSGACKHCRLTRERAAIERSLDLSRQCGIEMVRRNE